MEEEKDVLNKDDKFLDELERKVLQAIIMYNRPVTVHEIANELAIGLHRANIIFSKLIDKGNLIVLSSSKGRNKYYVASNSKEAIDKALSQKYVDLIEPLEKKYEEIRLEQGKLNEQLNSVYVQIITLMGIFVAIFALIIINVSSISEFVKNITDTMEMLKTLIILNVPLVSSLIILTGLIKWVIKPPKKKK